MSFEIRDLHTDDYPFIFNSWMKSYSKEYLDKKNVPSQFYYQGLHKLIELLLPTCLIKVAVAADDADLIIGYSVTSSDDAADVVHYVYVKQDFRRLGVGKALLDAAGISPAKDSIFTFHTPSGGALANCFGSLYHPFYIVNYLGDLLDNNR